MTIRIAVWRTLSASTFAVQCATVTQPEQG
ncbi:hypothetical protein C7434_1691 [Pantoea sp. PNA 14-12]|nr:hypothetical protein C7434_1691 [Pantoea sp. PNA 14-12]